MLIIPIKSPAPLESSERRILDNKFETYAAVEEFTNTGLSISKFGKISNLAKRRKLPFV